MQPIRSLLPLLLSLGAATAQVTGVAGINDFTINAFVPGSQSCTPLCIPAPTTLALNVSTVPGNPVLMFITSCPCRGCVVPWPPNACLPPIPPAPAPPCNSTTNQSLDILLNSACGILFTAFSPANAAGQATLTLPVPLLSSVPCGVTVSMQCVVFDTCGVGGPPVGPGPLVLTQAYSLSL